MSPPLIISATFIPEPTDVIAAMARMGCDRGAGGVEEAAPRGLSDQERNAAGERDAR
jgi:hypothetical protein